MQEFGTGLYLKDGMYLKKSIPLNYLNLTEENCAKLGNGEEKRLRCSSKERYLVSQDNVIKMARQVKVCDIPA